MAGKFGGLFEDIMSVFVSVGSMGVQHGGKSMLNAAGKKIGWVSSKSSKGGVLGGPSIRGHSFGNSFSGSREGLADMSQYDPKASYQKNISSGNPYAQKNKSSKAQKQAPQASAQNFISKPGTVIGQAPIAAVVSQELAPSAIHVSSDALTNLPKSEPVQASQNTPQKTSTWKFK